MIWVQIRMLKKGKLLGSDVEDRNLHPDTHTHKSESQISSATIKKRKLVICEPSKAAAGQRPLAPTPETLDAE